MKVFRAIACFASFVVLAAASGSAGSVNDKVGTSSFGFLKIPIGARAVGLGGAFTGLADDELAALYNPAGLANLEGDRVAMEYHNYFLDMQSGWIGYVRPLSYTSAVAFHIQYLSYGSFVQTDRTGAVTGEFGGGDLAIGGSYAIKRGEYFSFGATGRFLYESVQDYSSTGVAFDIGARYAAYRNRYTAGLTIQNLGVQFSTLGEGDKEKLPVAIRAGGGARPRGLPLQFAADLVVPIDNDPYVAVGAEILSLKPLLVRAGWNSFGSNYRAEGSDDNMAGLALGFGFELKDIRFLGFSAAELSYSYSPAADLGQSHRITLAGRRGI